MRIAVVGSGVSGLGALWRSMAFLAKVGRPVQVEFVVLEAGPTLGGCLSHTHQGPYLMEHGAQGVLLSRSPFMEWVRELGLEKALIVPSGPQIRYVLKENRFHKVSPLSLLSPQMLGVGGVCRALAEIFVKKGPGDEESIDAFFARRFGQKVAQSLGVPMATGIWGGASSKILIKYAFPKLVEWEKDYGSVVSGLMPRKRSQKGRRGLGSFVGGMGVFTQALWERCQALAKDQGWALSSVQGFCVKGVTYHKASSHFSIHGQGSGVGNTSLGHFDKVIWSVPPWRSLATLKSDDGAPSPEKAWRELTEAYTHDFVVVGVGGPGQGKEGFGAVCDSSSQDLLGILFIHSIYPQHCPQGHFLYRMMFGGDRDPQFIHLSDHEIQHRALSHLQSLGLVQKEFVPEFICIQRWPQAIAPPTEQIIVQQKAIHILEQSMPGLAMCGNYINGVGVADCLVTAQSAVDKLWGEALF